MKIMRLASGLGNSMFQYAAYLQLKRLYPKEEIYVDTIWYDYTGYPYELDRIFHLNTDAIDFHKILAQKRGIDFEEKLEELRFWKNFGYSSWSEIVKKVYKDKNYIFAQMSFIELPQLYLPYIDELQIQSAMKLTVRELCDKFPDITEYDLLNYRGKLVNQITNRIDSIAVKYLLAWLMPSKRKKIIRDLSNGKKPDLTDYPAIDSLKQTGNVYYNEYGHPDNTIGVKQQLYKAFTFPELNSKDLMDWAEIIKETESVAIHARVGGFENTFGIFMEGLLKRNYYKKAISYLRKKINKKVAFFVFSDDLDWCKENVQLFGIDCKVDEVHFVRGGVGDESYRDMQLISMCKHAVIPNSTFSWWGGYLNANPQKIIITPYGTLRGTTSF